MKKKIFLYFRKWNVLAQTLKTSYISGGNFPSFKNIKIHFEKSYSILGNGTF